MLIITESEDDNEVNEILGKLLKIFFSNLFGKRVH